MYKYALFDLDGTLTDPVYGITNSVMYALEKFGIHVGGRKELYKFIGPPLAEAFSEYYGFSAEQSALAIKYYREYFKEKGLYENELYRDTEKLLYLLSERGVKIVLATSKPEEFAVKILQHFDILKYFDFTAGATMDGKMSRKADVIKYAVDSLKISDLASAVMIGDREHDIAGAATVGIASIGVLYGYGTREELERAGARYIAENQLDIMKFVL